MKLSFLFFYFICLLPYVYADLSSEGGEGTVSARSITKDAGQIKFQNRSRMEATELLRDLIAAGVMQIGALDVAKLLSEVESVNWELSGVLFANKEKKDCATNYVASKSVSFAFYCEQNHSSASVKLIKLHESLGALGYRDEYFQILLRLYYSLPKNREVFAKSGITLNADVLKFKESDLRRTIVVAGNEGTSTTVGGGGSIIAWEVKLRAFELAILQAEDQSKWWEWMLNNDIKVLTDISNQNKIKGPSDISISALQWLAKNEGIQNAIINQVVETVKGSATGK